jgi:hypothetical protein
MVWDDGVSITGYLKQCRETNGMFGLSQFVHCFIVMKVIWPWVLTLTPAINV